MKIKEGFILHDVCGEKVIIAQGVENINFSKMINLNETAAFLWEKAVATDCFTSEQLVTWLTEVYEVDAEQATADVESMTAQWRKLGLIVD
jgi:hypothetical protein